MGWAGTNQSKQRATPKPQKRKKARVSPEKTEENGTKTGSKKACAPFILNGVGHDCKVEQKVLQSGLAA